MKDRRLSLLGRDDIPATYKLVALALIDAENEHGTVAGIRQSDIAGFIGVRRTYVATILRNLRDMGVIEFDHKPHHPAVYRFVGEYAPEQASLTGA
jgi:CRP-like cAMP-binding protein